MNLLPVLQGQEKPTPKTVSSTPAPVEIQDPAPPSTQQDVMAAPTKLDPPRPTQVDVPRPAQEDVPQPLTQTDAIKDANQTQPGKIGCVYCRSCFCNGLICSNHLRRLC